MSRVFAVSRRLAGPLAVALLGVTLGGCLRDRDSQNRRDDPFTAVPARIPDSRRSVSVRDNDRDLPDSRTTAGLAIREPDRNRDSNSDRDRNPVQTTGWTGSDADRVAGPKLQTPVVSKDGRESRSGGPVRIRTFEDGAAFLTARDCRGMQLQLRDKEWYFECSIPSRRNSNSVKTYTAHDKYGLIAMQMVIDDILRDQGLQADRDR
jgi:hypothetical protein